MQAGYDFTLPKITNSLTMTVSAAQVTFAVSQRRDLHRYPRLTRDARGATDPEMT